MKKLILPLLFIFLAAAAFGQTEKEPLEMEKYHKLVSAIKKDFKKVNHYPMSVEKMKKLKARPALSKHWNFGPKGIKPKDGYIFLVNGKGQLITWKQGEEGEPNPEKSTNKASITPEGHKADFLGNPKAEIICACSSKTADEGDGCKVGIDEESQEIICVLDKGQCTCEEKFIFSLGANTWTFKGN